MNWDYFTDGEIILLARMIPLILIKRKFIFLFCDAAAKLSFGNPSGKHVKLHECGHVTYKYAVPGQVEIWHTFDIKGFFLT